MQNHTAPFDLTLFHFPGACSIVTMTALEEIGIPYKDVLIDLFKGEQHGQYREINPKGKVPALLIDGTLLTENAAILLWLHRTHPTAKLLPDAASELESAQQYSDMLWAAATWHPVVRSVRLPARLTDGDEEPVRARGMQLLIPLIETLESKFKESNFFYGDTWSIFDVYLHWLYTTAEIGGVDLEGFPAIRRHRAEIEVQPSVISAKERSDKASHQAR